MSHFIYPSYDINTTYIVLWPNNKSNTLDGLISFLHNGIKCLKTDSWHWRYNTQSHSLGCSSRKLFITIDPVWIPRLYTPLHSTQWQVFSKFLQNDGRQRLTDIATNVSRNCASCSRVWPTAALTSMLSMVMQIVYVLQEVYSSKFLTSTNILNWTLLLVREPLYNTPQDTILYRNKHKETRRFGNNYIARIGQLVGLFCGIHARCSCKLAWFLN